MAKKPRLSLEAVAVVIDVAMWVALYWRNYGNLWLLGQGMSGGAFVQGRSTWPETFLGSPGLKPQDADIESLVERRQLSEEPVSASGM